MAVDYIQTTNPGPVGAGKMWLNDETQDLQVRDFTNSNWVLLANLAQTRGGNVPVSGAVLTGPITGSHGLAGLDSPAFTTAAKLDGRDLARITDLASMRKEILASMNSRVQEIISRASGSSIVNNIAFEVVDHTLAENTTFTVSLPKYPDGTDAKASEVRSYGAHFKTIHIRETGNSTNQHMTIVESSVGSRVFTVQARNDDPTSAGANLIVSSYILCTR